MSFRLVPFDKLLFENLFDCWVECVVGARLGQVPVRYRALIRSIGSPGRNIEIYADKFLTYSQSSRSWNETGNTCSLRVFSIAEREWYVGPYAHNSLGILWMKLKIAEKSMSYFRIYPTFHTPSKEPMFLGDFIDLRREFSPPIPESALKDA